MCAWSRPVHESGAMSGFEWFLLVVVVIIVPLVVAVMVTLWTLEQARQRKRQNRPEGEGDGPVKRRAVRDPATDSTLVAAPLVVAGGGWAAVPGQTILVTAMPAVMAPVRIRRLAVAIPVLPIVAAATFGRW